MIYAKLKGGAEGIAKTAGHDYVVGGRMSAGPASIIHSGEKTGGEPTGAKE